MENLELKASVNDEKPKILIVDDREREIRTLVRLLSRFDAETMTATSGQEALKIMLEEEFILVLLDVQMPLMDGMETATLMRMNDKTKDVPIIFLTAYDKDEIRVLQGYELGAIDYLMKPINEQVLLSKVDIFLRSYLYKKDRDHAMLLRELEVRNAQLEERTEALTRQNRELEHFAYVATHDLRAPLVNMKTLSEMYRSKGYIHEKGENIFKRLSSSIHRMDETLNDLISVVSHKKTLQEELVYIDLKDIIEGIVQDYSEKINHLHANIIIKLDEVNSFKYIRSHIHSIFQNLISNALKYRHSERDPEIEITAEQSGGKVIVHVQDNGSGIKEGMEDKVFGLFQRLTKSEDGKGIGMYIVRSQIEALGGSVVYTSVLHEGSRFSVTLIPQ